VSGQVKAGFVATTGVVQHVREGRLRGLAISAARRSEIAPDVPTMAEAGYPDFNVDSHFVALVPAGTPDAIADLLEREIRQAVQLPDLHEKLKAHDVEPIGSSSADATARLNAETALWARVVKAANMRIN
jgi:tripartite-type tricarboxylate transporter receptor subunit TctC